MTLFDPESSPIFNAPDPMAEPELTVMVPLVSQVEPVFEALVPLKVRAPDPALLSWKAPETFPFNTNVLPVVGETVVLEPSTVDPSHVVVPDAVVRMEPLFPAPKSVWLPMPLSVNVLPAKPKLPVFATSSWLYGFTVMFPVVIEVVASDAGA